MNKILEIALGEYGTQEIVGAKHNQRVLEYFAKTGNSWVHDDETAWCAAFVGFCLETGGIASTKKLNARSYLTWSQPTLTPKLGDIVVFQRDNSPVLGHVAFVIKISGDSIYVLGGNQANAVNIEKMSLKDVLGYRTY